MAGSGNDKVYAGTGNDALKGDGGNDLGMVANAGLGVAMGNAVPAVAAAAHVVVGSNDDHGVAEAIERFVL